MSTPRASQCATCARNNQAYRELAARLSFGSVAALFLVDVLCVLWADFL
jgi:hypothetical protein